MRILITGSSGLIGSALIPYLLANDNTITRLVRSKIGRVEEEAIYWNPDKGEIDADRLEGYDALLHLAGETILGRWTKGKKERIEKSRVVGGKLISESLSNLRRRPKVLIAASAIGYYGERGAEVLTEESSPGKGFMAEVCVKWENSFSVAKEAQIRVVNLRIGIVLSTNGGALSKMLTPFKMGVGGRVGNGDQFWSWISIDDVLGVVNHCLLTETLSGPINLVAPNPVTNREFTEVLGGVLSRPTVLPLPSFLARGLFGEMADEAMLSSVRAYPSKLLNSGYKFRYPELTGALRHLL